LAKTLVVGLTIAAVFVVAEIKSSRGERDEEARAIAALRAVVTAQRAYAAFNGAYATSLKTLAAACPGEQHGFISPDFSDDPTGIGSYEIWLRADADAPTEQADCQGNTTAPGYYATAVPLQPTRAATRALGVDQNGVIWYDVTGAAPKPPFSETTTLKPFR
jgi:type II secretory pathway pseudopilin PulG